MEDLAVVVLAAGQGTRMKSKTPKVLHRLAGKPMVCHVLDAVSVLDPSKVVLVIGHEGEQVRRALERSLEFVEQTEQMGTGHAVLRARPLLEGMADHILVLYGDTPLLRGDTLQGLVDLHYRSGATITMLVAQAEDPRGYGRIIRVDGEIRGIVEEQAATEEQKLLREINSGVYCFDAAWLWGHLPEVPLNEKGEYYLTDLIALAPAEGRVVRAFAVEDPDDAMGVNDRVQLAEAESLLQWRIRQQLMLSGVTMVDPGLVFVDADVVIGQDTVIYPGSFLRGRTRIGEGCVIGPNSYIEDSGIAAKCRIFASVVEGAVVDEGVSIGPFSHLRQGAHLAEGVHLGNFAEVKNSFLGHDTKQHHFSYIGDATVGKRVNIGAGTITCNFDAETGEKHRTVIEDDVALGSDTMLVAPVRVGRGGETGAGSVVTKDIPPECLAVGVPAKVVRKVTKVVRKV